MDTFLIKFLRQCNYAMAAICLLSGLFNMIACFRHNMWTLLPDGLLLLVAGALLLHNGNSHKEE